MICRFYAVPPPGSLFFIMAAAIGAYSPVGGRDALVQAGALTRTQIRDLFGRHEQSGRIDHALQMLLRKGRARVEQRSTGGRPVEVWIPA
jgi:hypothetical protein